MWVEESLSSGRRLIGYQCLSHCLTCWMTLLPGNRSLPDSCLGYEPLAWWSPRRPVLSPAHAFIQGCRMAVESRVWMNQPGSNELPPVRRRRTSPRRGLHRPGATGWGCGELASCRCPLFLSEFGNLFIGASVSFGCSGSIYCPSCCFKQGWGIAGITVLSSLRCVWCRHA